MLATREFGTCCKDVREAMTGVAESFFRVELQRLPDDGSAELDDGMTPVVDESAVSRPKLVPE
jgi:hypothetical protein